MRWQPAHVNHSIEKVTVTVQFREMVPTKLWQELLDTASSHLPSLGFGTRIDTGGGLPMPVLPPALQQAVVRVAGILAPNELGGRMFQAVDGTEVRGQIIFQRNYIAVTASRYDRWADFLAHLGDSIAALVEGILPIVDLQMVKLEYWDRFTFNGHSSDASYLELLHEKSQFLPGLITKTDQLWHSHVGYFTEAPVGSTRLVNVNVDALDIPSPDENGENEKKRSVGIYSLAQDTVETEYSPKTFAQVSSALDDLHTFLKDVLADVITPEASKRISLVEHAVS